jgi:hypothetical protein
MGLRRFWLRRSLLLVILSLMAVSGCTLLSNELLIGGGDRSAHAPTPSQLSQSSQSTIGNQQPISNNGRPQLSPLPVAPEVWNCQVIVIGGSLGGVAAAAHAMQSGAITCLIELSPWLGGQISAQGVSAIDESLTMRAKQNFSQSWINFKHLIEQQTVSLPNVNRSKSLRVQDLNRCWVGKLCFPPQAGAIAAQQLLQTSATQAPGSRWGTAIAFKGAEFDATGENITAIYGVRRSPRQADYKPQGRLSTELSSWYSWSGDQTFTKVPLLLQAIPGQRLIVIDATDTGELVGWANLPHRLGSESRTTTGERHAADRDNSDCTQAFTFPFAIAIHKNHDASPAGLNQISSLYSSAEHQSDFAIRPTPMFTGRSFFHYRRIISTTGNNPLTGTPALGDIAIVNWNRGNDWNWMNPPLILNAKQLDASGQRQNWLGGISAIALRHAEDHALLFAKWLLQTQATLQFPLTYLSGTGSETGAGSGALPDIMGTISGLSPIPYIREGRRILGRPAYGQQAFTLREADLRSDLPGGRDFEATAIAMIHYDIDIHGCRYRNWEPTGEATSAPAREFKVRPLQIPLESLIPQEVNNLLIGGKGIAVTHIANAVTRIHYSEWSVGAAAGATAGWLVTQAPPDLTLAKIAKRARISKQLMPELRQHLHHQGLRWQW